MTTPTAYVRSLRRCVPLLVCLLGFSACRDNSPALSGERDILSFRFEDTDPISVGVIDRTQNLITVVVPHGTDRRALIPTVEVSEGATLEPPANTAQDFNTPVIYTVTAEDGARNSYTVVLEDGPSSDTGLAGIRFPALFLSERPSDAEVDFIFDVPFGTDISNLQVTLTPNDPAAAVEPASGSILDFSSPVSFVVTAADGIAKQQYSIRFTVNKPETGVRGVWLTNVDSDVLNTREGIVKAVAQLSELNINTVFVVTYNKAMTTYPSKVMENLTGVRINPLYEGRDPLRELIDAAHAENIKVFAWFEYGFAAFNGRPGPILEAKPEWAAIASNGKPVVKNGFYWLNTVLPTVQQFMIDLYLEVVRNYPDIDGIQGDDRLPAMPAEAGYDDFTVNKYRTAHNGQDPPTDRTDGKWRDWRARIVNDFARDWYDAIKKENPRCLVSVSPSPLNFGFVEYLQDYETWVKEGICDMVHPQLYRRDFQGLGVYRGLLDSQIRRVGVHTDKFYPGLLSFLSGYVPDPEFLADMIRENRRRGIMGEVHFFYNVVLVRAEVLKAMYPAPATFPSFD